MDINRLENASSRSKPGLQVMPIVQFPSFQIGQKLVARWAEANPREVDALKSG